MKQQQNQEDIDKALEVLWNDVLANIPTNDDDELELPFLHFDAGDDRQDVWQWFHENHSKGIMWLMYGEPPHPFALNNAVWSDKPVEGFTKVELIEGYESNNDISYEKWLESVEVEE